jgi:uncharacterized protein YyaL (SSP411 family)
MSAIDADAEGTEGRFYAWTPEELREVLGADADDAMAWFGVTQEGNFEGASILVRAPGGDPPAERLADVRRRLYAARARRTPPGRDDKRITAWNALMVSALADAGAVLERPDYVEAAEACAAFLLGELRRPGGEDGGERLLRTWKDGEARLDAYLEDHAFLVEALLTLYEATFQPRWFHAARELADTMIARFADEDRGGFFTTADDHEALIARRKDLADTPLPSGNSSAALGLLRLAALTGEAEYERRAAGVLGLVHELAVEHPQTYGHALQALELSLRGAREVALVGEDTTALERIVRSALRPRVVLAGGPADGVPLLHGREPVGGAATAYVCEHFACRRPVQDPAELAALLA